MSSSKSNHCLDVQLQNYQTNVPGTPVLGSYQVAILVSACLHNLQTTKKIHSSKLSMLRKVQIAWFGFQWKFLQMCQSHKNKNSLGVLNAEQKVEEIS